MKAGNSKKARILFFALCSLLLAPCFPAQAQESGKVPRIGYLSRGAGPWETTKVFLQALRDLGWTEGKNIAIEYRWAAYKMDRLPVLADELVRLKVDLIVTATQLVTRAA
ncbi:MAG: hypothetical protein OEN50_20950, partial [Deltaproteobacteria bacterium]|nr:hypothetical protein [Deltaproteobacteria bacterium]